MGLDVRGVEAPGALELYVTATPEEFASAEEQAEGLFARVAGALREHGAWIAQERVFAPAEAVEALRRIRGGAYGELDDGVEPAWLVAPGRQVAGIQVHAVRTGSRPQALEMDGARRARSFEQNGCRWVLASGLTGAGVDGAAQARAAFEKAERLLKQAGGDMRHVARTWIFMDDILGWYDEFNRARTGFFIERGILGRGGDDEGRMPASTGIGVSPAGSARCCMDLFAVVGGSECVRRYHAAGKQKSAYEYGSAFARAAEARSPAGKVVFVSGTAAIDASGATCCVNDAAGQVQMTLENVTAVLNQMGSGVRDVVQAIAYCATPMVKNLFEGCWAEALPWPWVTLIGDVCRDDLLFEVEVTAAPGSRVLSRS